MRHTIDAVMQLIARFDYCARTAEFGQELVNAGAIRTRGMKGTWVGICLTFAYFATGMSALTAQAADITPCGGEGQRACCWLEETFGDCQAGLVQIPVANTGQCAKALPGIQSNGICVSYNASCGGLGQRACCVVERQQGRGACAGAWKEVSGCSGDCTCGGPPFGNIRPNSSSMCTVIEKISEPDTGWTPPAANPPSGALVGYADIHLHLFGHMGHGGGLIAGKPYDADGGVNAALGQDYGTNLPLVNSNGKTLLAPDCPSFLGNCGNTLFHGWHTLFDTATGFGTQDNPGVGLNGSIATPSNLGAPLFNGWPTWRSTVHQQAYYKWLERAWRGGLRLIVMMAVTNEALCMTSRRLSTADCKDSMSAIYAQLTEARTFEKFVDAESRKKGEDGWFRIVTRPQDARKVIGEGKLAVVLGVEVDNLFNCKRDADVNTVEKPCHPSWIALQLSELYGIGVRHVFPIHNFDNAFGGAATWQSVINVANKAVEGNWWAASGCPVGYGFSLGSISSIVQSDIVQLFGFGLEIALKPEYHGPSCNDQGLTDSGRNLVNALMDVGMLIDVDHMSNAAFHHTLTIAESRNYPVVASHVQLFDLNQQSIRHERMRTRDQLERIKNVGGMIGVMLKDDQQDTDNIGKKLTIPASETTIFKPVRFGQPQPPADDCRHSSKSFAQMLVYSVAVMGGPVAFGSDFNGVAGHVGPRFGSDACGGVNEERVLQGPMKDNGLSYPFTASIVGLSISLGTFERQVTGQKTFDFNVDGLAHVGLLPDLVADLTKVGVVGPYIPLLFGSAEAYIKVWERACLLSVAGKADSSNCISN